MKRLRALIDDWRAREWRRRAMLPSGANGSGSNVHTETAGEFGIRDMALPTIGRPARPRAGYGSPPPAAELKGARLSLNLTLRDVEARMGIRAEYLAGIESGDPNLVPGQPFGIGYVRAYAKFLDTRKFFGKDPEWYVEQYRSGALVADFVPDAEPGAVLHEGSRAESRGERRHWDLAMRAGIAGLAILLCGGAWYGFNRVQYLSVSEPQVVVSVAAVPASVPEVDASVAPVRVERVAAGNRTLSQ